MCIIFGNVIRQSRSIGINWDCEIIFKQLGEMANTYIIFCYIQELSEFYFLHNQQPTTNNYQRTPRNFSEVYKIRFEIFGRYAI